MGATQYLLLLQVVVVIFVMLSVILFAVTISVIGFYLFFLICHAICYVKFEYIFDPNRITFYFFNYTL